MVEPVGLGSRSRAGGGDWGMKSMGEKGADLFQKGGRTKKQAAGRGTSRYSIGIKS